MAIIFDATSTGAGAGAGAPVVHTMGVGAKPILLAWICQRAGVADGDPTVTYNAVPMTIAPGGGKAIGSDVVWCFYQVTPATGANNLTVTLAGARGHVIFGASYFGVDQTTPLEDLQSDIDGGNNPSTITTTDIGDLIVSAPVSRGLAAYSFNGTKRNENDNGVNTDAACGDIAGGTAIASTWTHNSAEMLSFELNVAEVPVGGAPIFW